MTDQKHVVICSICHTITKLASYHGLTAAMREHHSLHRLPVASVLVILDPNDETEPWVSDFINYRVQYMSDTNGEENGKDT